MEYSCQKCKGVLTKCLASGGISNFSVTKLPEKYFLPKKQVRFSLLYVQIVDKQNAMQTSQKT